MADSSHMFIFGVFVFYGLLFFFFDASSGAIVGLPSDESFGLATPDTSGITNYLVGGIDVILSFFAVMFLTPLSGIEWLLPFNWALTGTTIYLFIRMIRGGG